MTAEERYIKNQWLTQNYIKRNFPAYVKDEDMLQCARIGLWAACTKSDNESPIAWIAFARRCIRNEILNEIRARKRAAPPPAAYVPLAYDPSEAVNCQIHVDAELDRMDERTRRIVERVAFEGATYAEVGAEMGLSGTRVSQIAKYAIQQLERGKI